MDDIAESFWSKVAKAGADECWLWMGHVNATHGYGQMQHGPRGSQTSWRAHRLSYLLNKGPLTEGLVVMHLCDNRRCVNPNHLRLGTVADNNLDGRLKGRMVDPPRNDGQRKTACKRGHSFTPANTIIKQGKRVCRACRDAANRGRDRRKK